LVVVAKKTKRPGARLKEAFNWFLVSAARLAGSHIIREEGASSTSEIASAARLCAQRQVFVGAMAEGACLIAQRTAGTEGAKTSMLVLSAPSSMFSFPIILCSILCSVFLASDILLTTFKNQGWTGGC